MKVKCPISAYLCFFRIVISAVDWGRKKTDEEIRRLDDATKKFRFSVGNSKYLANRERFSENAFYEQEQSMTNCATLDAILEQV